MKPSQPPAWPVPLKAHMNNKNSNRSTALDLAFRSGMSRNHDLRAGIDAGVPVGVVAGELTTLLIFRALPNYLASGGAVFIDSGAFGELKTGVAPNFDAVLRTYESVAEIGWGGTPDMSRLYVVAPDKVGDQWESLVRLAQHGPRVRALIDAGVQVIVPIQCGALTPMAMIDAVAQILDTDAFIAGIPSNAAAMSLEECASIRHHSFHILGRVQKNDEQLGRIMALRHHQPDAPITADANWLRSRLRVVSQNAEELRAAGAHRTLWADSVRTQAVAAAIKSDTAWAA